MPTGAAHWGRRCARAIENKAYVVAAAQGGTHAGLPDLGHTMIVDPWGEILASWPKAKAWCSARSIMNASRTQEGDC